jgi:DNA-binding MarR family transcriptional regulator
MLKRLETLGYIGRKRDSGDERQVRINLTEAGKKLHLQVSNIVQSVRDATGLRDEQVTKLKEEVDALRRALESH